MQLPADADLAAAVEASDRSPVIKLEVDWDKDGLYAHPLSNLTSVVDSAQVQRDISGTLPASITLVEGYSAAKMTVQLSGLRPGDLQSIAVLLAPWQGWSTWFFRGRVDVPIRLWATVRKPSGVETQIQQFAGRVKDFTIDSGSRSVTLLCGDLSEDINKPITLPLGGMPNQGQAISRTQDYRMNSQWVIDYVLRQNGLYATPSPHADCIYSATMHGSLVPEIGFHYSMITGLGSITEDHAVVTAARTPGIVACGGSDTFVASAVARAAHAFRPQPGAVWTVEFDARVRQGLHPEVDGTVVAISSGRGAFVGTSMGVRLWKGELWVDFYNAGVKAIAYAGPTTTAYETWHEVKVTVEFGTPMTNSAIHFKLGTTTSTLTGVNLGALSSSPDVFAWATVTTQVPFPVSDLQVTEGGTSVWHDLPNWTPQCYIDPGLNEFNTLPIEENKPSWQLLKEVAGAEFGVIGFDEKGFFSFRNRDTVRRQGLDLDKTLSVEKTVKGLRVSERLESVRNVIQFETAERWITINKYSTVYTADTGADMVAPPGVTRLVVQLTEPCWLNDGLNLTRYTTANWNAQNPTAGFVALNTSSGAEATAVAIAVYALPDGRSAQIDIVNNETVPIKFATTDGKQAFRVDGSVFVNDARITTEYRRTSSILTFGERSYSVPNSVWHQRPRGVQRIAELLLKDLKRPVPIVEQIPCVGDPRLQLLDTGDLLDPAGTGHVYVVIEGITRTFSRSEGLTDQLTVRPYSAPDAWILGHSQWSVLGQTTVPG